MISMLRYVNSSGKSEISAAKKTERRTIVHFSAVSSMGTFAFVLRKRLVKIKLHKMTE